MNTSNENIVLELQSVSKIFKSKGKSFKAVDNVSLSLKKGETLSIVGESGSGKTTIGRLAIKLIDTDEGKIIFKGNDITHLSKKEFRSLRPSIQIIFQDPYSSLNPRMNVKKLLEEAAIHGVKEGESLEDYIEALINNVGLSTSDLYKYPHEFSGGQRQRISIARAIATRPEIIICDEPVSALDLLVQAQILELLKNLQEIYGFAYIFISHNLSVVCYMSDKIAVMCLGKIVEEGTAIEIFENPQHIYTKLLLNSSLKFDDLSKGNIADNTYYEEKYYEAIDYVRTKSNNKVFISDTHYILAD